MNQSDGKHFFRELVFVHMPQVNGWLNQHSPKPDETLGVWCTVLHDVEVTEAIRVINRWVRGELPSPTGFELAEFALHLRAVVMQDRYEARKHLVRQAIVEKPTGSRAPLLMWPYVNRILANGDSYRNGEISLEECRERNKVIIEEFARAGR